MTPAAFLEKRMTLTEFIEKNLDALLMDGVTRLDGNVDKGEVTMYWVGTVLRIDLKPEAKP